VPGTGGSASPDCRCLLQEYFCPPVHGLVDLAEQRIHRHAAQRHVAAKLAVQAVRPVGFQARPRIVLAALSLEQLPDLPCNIAAHRLPIQARVLRQRQASVAKAQPEQDR